MCGRSVAFQRGAKEVSRARTPALCIQIDPQSASLARVLIIHRLVTVRPQWVRLIIYAATSAEKCTRFLLFAAHPLSLRLVCKHAHDSNSTQFEPGEKEAEEVMCWLASKPGLRVPHVAFWANYRHESGLLWSWGLCRHGAFSFPCQVVMEEILKLRTILSWWNYTLFDTPRFLRSLKVEEKAVMRLTKIPYT